MKHFLYERKVRLFSTMRSVTYMKVAWGQTWKDIRKSTIIFRNLPESERTAVAQWLKYCATNRKVGGSIADGVIGIFH